jgi:predicted nucleic acid-binding protein
MLTRLWKSCGDRAGARNWIGHAVVTALDSSILLDVLTNDPTHGANSMKALREARSAGRMIVCPIVWAEIRGFFADPAHMQRTLNDAEIQFDPFDQECADVAGANWHRYRRAGGSRTRLMSDFLIGAHAFVRSDELLTRDRGFFRRYFAGLTVKAPA